MSDKDAILIAMFVLLVCFATMFGLSLSSLVNIKSDAIQHNCAQYNHQTGEFKWRDR